MATQFVLDGWQVAEEIIGNDVTTYVAPGVVSKIQGSDQIVFHSDSIGNTRITTDEDQAVTGASIYDAYGNVVQDYPSSSTPAFGLAGQYRYFRDAANLSQLTARYYDSQTGRLISKDPIGYAGGINLYECVAGMPTVAVEPYGTSILGDIGGMLPGAWEDVYGGQAGNNYAWCVLKCGLNYAGGFIPLPIGIDFGPGFSNPSIGFNPPALIGMPGLPIFQ